MRRPGDGAVHWAAGVRRLATITEFGSADNDDSNLLRDLELRADRLRQQGFSVDQVLLTTFGPTDVVEVCTFDHLLHLAEVGGSSSNVFRRSMGVLCPNEADLAALRPSTAGVELATVEDLLGPDADRPLVLVSYLKLGPLASFFARAPGPSASGFPDPLLARLVGSSRLWRHYAAVESANLKRGEAPPLRLAPTMGLDAVEVVLLARAARLEQLAALAWVCRQARIDTLWARARPPAQLGQLLERDVGAAAWHGAPAFSTTASTVGMPMGPLRRAATRAELCASAEPLAASAVFTERRSFLSGHFEAVRGPRADADGFLMLFDRMDLLHSKGDLAEAQVTRGAAARHLARFVPCDGSADAGAGASAGGEGGGVRTVAELAVRLRPAAADAPPLPDGALSAAFRGRLRRAVERDVLRDGAGWTFRWLKATRQIGFDYPATNGIVNLISAVGGYLQEDLEGFLDLVPAIEAVVAEAERAAATWPATREESIAAAVGGRERVAQLRWMCDVVVHAAEVRGRRDHPLRPPRNTIAFEGHAGYRLWRDAFHQLVRVLVDGAAGDSLLVVQDGVAGPTQCNAGPLGGVQFLVSAMVLHHPLHWAYGHEIGHLVFDRPCDRWSTEVGAAWDALARLVNLPERPPARPRDLFGCIARALPEAATGSLPSQWLVAMGQELAEIAADLVMWRGLQGTSEAAQRRAFWTLMGPALVNARCEAAGRWPMSPRRQLRVVVRLVAVSVLTDAAAASAGGGAAERLLGEAFAAAAAAAAATSATGLPPIAARLRAFGEDLGWTPDMWGDLGGWLENLQTAVPWAAAPPEARAVQAALDCAAAIARQIGPEPPVRATASFVRYLDDLGPDDRPWPRTVVGTAEGRLRASAQAPATAHPAGAPLFHVARGGVLASDQPRYNARTLAFLLELDAASRGDRLERLIAFIQR